MTYSIRKANSNDINNLLSMSRRVTNYNNRQFLSDTMVDNFLQSDYFIKEITNNIEDIDILMLNYKIIGMCRFNENIIESLMVDVDYQGTGASSLFLKQLVNKKLEHYKEIKLECFKSNKRARRFYEKAGFQLYSTYENKEINQEMCIYRTDKLIFSRSN